MKSYLTDIFIFFGLLLMVLIVSVGVVGNETVDVQLHDLYLEVNRNVMLIWIFGPLVFLTFLVRALLAKFRSIASNAGLILGAVHVSVLIYGVIQFRQTFTNEQPTLLWAILITWLTGILVLIGMTVNVWRHQ